MQGTIQWLLFTNSIHAFNTYQPGPVINHLQILDQLVQRIVGRGIPKCLNLSVMQFLLFITTAVLSACVAVPSN